MSVVVQPAEVRPAEARPAEARGLVWLAGLGLVLLALLSRAPSFVMSVINWDESLYVIMAEQWRAGHLPYTAVWDNKPVGIYAIFALFQWVFGDRIVAIRLAALLAVTATALLIWRIARHLLRDRPPRGAECASSAAAALYILATIPDDGMAANTELFMEGFICLGLLWALTRPARGPIGGGRALGIGLILGIAFMIKYVAVFDMVAVFAGMTMLPGRRRQGRAGGADVLRLGLWFSLGVLAPFVTVALLYAAAGAFPVFLDASLLSNLRRVALPFSGRLTVQAYERQAALLPLLYGGLAVLAITLARKPRAEGFVLLGWVLTSALGVAAGGLYFSHYFIQILPPLCIAAGLLLARIGDVRRRAGRAALLVLVAASLMPTAAAIVPVLGYMLRIAARPAVGCGLLRDTPTVVATDLRPVLARHPGAMIFVFDGEPVLYALLHTPLPTRYVFPSFLESRLLAHMIGIDPVAELARILAHRPLFIIRRSNPDLGPAGTRNREVYRLMQAKLAADYVIWKRYDTMVVWQRRTEDQPGPVALASGMVSASSSMIGQPGRSLVAH